MYESMIMFAEAKYNVLITLSKMRSRRMGIKEPEAKSITLHTTLGMEHLASMQVA